jgi:hypothetical protein
MWSRPAGYDAGVNGEAGDDLIDSWEQIGELLRREEPLYVRHSKGYDVDASSCSMDGESGLELPGLSANPMNPEAWWSRPWQDWIARQICQYRHLSQDDAEAQTWLLTGRVVGRGPDCEPLLTDVRPMGRLGDKLISEAEERYDAEFHRQ